MNVVARPHIIGLTGGIASGKSTVSAHLRQLGATVVDADVLARDVVERGTPGLAAVVSAFGPQVLTADGTLDRPKLGAIVFQDEVARQKLNGIVHPLVRAKMQSAIAAAAATGIAIVVLDIPLLYEGRLQAMCHEVWVVTVGAEEQLARLQERDSLSPAAAQARMAAQMPLEEKVKRADVVIDNSGTRVDTFAQVERAWHRVQSNQTSR